MSNHSKQPFANATRAYPEKDISSLLNKVTSLTDLQAVMSVISPNRDSISIALKSLEHGRQKKKNLDWGQKSHVLIAILRFSK